MYTRESIKELGSKVDIVELVGRYCELEKRGKYYWGCCPFHEELSPLAYSAKMRYWASFPGHDEKTPSLVVNPEEEHWYCFGCDNGGDARRFIGLFYSLDFDAAYEKLASMVGFSLEEQAVLPPSEPSAAEKLGSAATDEPQPQELDSWRESLTNGMTIDLVTDSAGMAFDLRVVFSECSNVNVYEGDLAEYLASHPETDAIVAPANSYGLMDGGFDKAITDAFGWELAEAAQGYILGNFCGEQPVATSFSIPIPGHEGVRLIHTPTMRVPSPIADPLVVYQCMRTSLIEAMRTSRKHIAVPAFGGTCGLLPPMKVAQLMLEGYRQVCNPPTELSWEYADSRRLEDRYR